MSEKSNDEQSPPAELERDPVARLLRAAGPRLQPPAALEHEVWERTHADWRALTASRRRRTTRWLAVAASLLAAVGTGWWMSTSRLGEAPVLGTIAVLADGANLRLAGRSEPLRTGEVIHTGQRLQSDGGAALSLTAGGSLRLAAGTEFTAESPGRIELLRGAVYFDSGHETGERPPFLVDTELGSVAHAGTQFETRLSEGRLRIRVREGSIELRRGPRLLIGNAGEELALTADGATERRPVATFGPEWAWADALAPSFDIDGEALAAFLDWAARQTGRKLVYATEAARAVASDTRLHGSIRGFSPEEALRAVLATTALTEHVQEDRLVIELR